MGKIWLNLAIGPISLALLATHTLGADPMLLPADPHDAEIAAATENARAALRLDLLDRSITPALTVEDLLEHSGKTRPFDLLIAHAERVGGIRWLDEQTCQVRLEITGRDAVGALLKIASDKSTHVPKSAGEFRRALQEWRDLDFTADGTSIAPGLAARLAPAPGGPWALVSDRDRQAALIAARDNAINRIVQGIGMVALPRGHRLAELLADREASATVMNWLQTRPITAVEFGDDLEIRLTISAPPPELWDFLRPALSAQLDVPIPNGDAGWQALRSAVFAHVGPGVGRAIAIAAAPAQPLFVVPVRPPAWSVTIAAAEGDAQFIGSPLHTARAAERIALDQLRVKIDHLPFNGQTTLGQAAAIDPAIARGIDRAMDRAQTSQVNYDTPIAGAVQVKVQLPLALLWHEISGQ